MNIEAFLYLDRIRNVAFKLPGVTEQPCYGTPGFYAGKKLFLRLREEGDLLVVYTEDREHWMKQDPGTFFITEHYKNVPYMLVLLTRVTQPDLVKLIQTAWSKRIGKKILKEWEINAAQPNKTTFK
jgi:hypothetical protein